MVGTTGRKTAVVDLLVQIACLVLLTYWTCVLVKPFLTIIVWSIIFAVLLYPVFERMAGRLRLPRVLAALFLTALSLAIILGPAAWLGVSLIETLRSIAAKIGAGDIAVPPPPDSVRSWPLVGDQTFELWSLASTNLKAALLQIAPDLGSIRSSLLDFAANAGTSIGG